MPYLEDRWLAWVTSLPYPTRNNGGVSKAIFKALCARTWGQDLAHRKKIGFLFPMRTWIREGKAPLLTRFRGMLLEQSTLDRGIYRKGVLLREIQARLQGRSRPLDWLLWSLINLEVWLRSLGY